MMPTTPARRGQRAQPNRARSTQLDRALLSLFSAEPRLGVLEASRRLRVARGTVQSRLDRLERDGVITGWAPSIAPAALGYGVTAFVTLQITQHAGRQGLERRLGAIPELLECWTVTGSGDLWCRIVARSNTDLQRVIDQMVVDETVIRASTLIALSESDPVPDGPPDRSNLSPILDPYARNAESGRVPPCCRSRRPRAPRLVLFDSPRAGQHRIGCEPTERWLSWLTELVSPL